jgi:putative membrane protein
MIDYDAHDWWSHFFDVRGSMVLDIVVRILVATFSAALVAGAHQVGWHVAIPATAHSLIGVALGLLLVFRTNASYDRFWEGRKLWGGMVNTCRNIARVGVTLFKEPRAYAELAELVRAFPLACMNTLRGAPQSLSVRSDIAKAQHVPLAICRDMGRVINDERQSGHITDIQQAMMDGHVSVLMDIIGACERIRKTPLPFAYVVHLRRALMIYTVTLPFCLVEPLRWWSVLATSLVAFVLFGIEEIGVEIEDPFGTDANDLPLEKICATIDANIQALR